MDSYKIEWKRAAVKELKKLPDSVVLRVLQAVEQLSAEPFPHGARKLVGSEHTFRIREVSYRIVYNVVASTLTIEMIRVRHRKDVYDR